MKKKLLSLFLVGAMAASLLAGCGDKKEQGNDASNTPGESTETAAGKDTETTPVSYSNKQVILGEITEPNGDITPSWTNGATDYDAFKLITGQAPVERDKDGKWIDNPTVAESIEATENEDGSRTYTIKIKDGLLWSNGDPITASDYVFFYMFWGSNEVLADLEATEANAYYTSYVKGFDKYSTGESDTFEGIHLIDENTYSVTIDAKFLPYYYGKALVANQPEYMKGWVPEDVTLEETENGVKFSDNYTAEYIGDSVEKYRYNPTACSGPYMFTSFDANAYTYTLTKNPNYPGNYEGQTANIETVLLKYVKVDTMMDQLKTGAVDILVQVADGDKIEAGLDMVEEGGFDYITFPRAGYGMLSFKCNQGPTQFKEVRHAIAYLLDRVTFAQTFTGGHGSVVNGPYGLQQWMVDEYAEEVDGLNSYTYSLDEAVKVLEEGGWVYNEDGSDYSGTGIRHKKLEDGTYMPLVIEWFSSENNPVSDLLVTSLQKSKDVEAAGMKINQTVGAYTDLQKYYYDNSEDNPYQMFNLATGFGNPYDVAYSFEPGSGSNLTALTGEEGQKIYDFAVAMNQTEEGDDAKYAENWFNFISYWNEQLPEVPLYSNDYHDFFTSKLHDFEEDGYNWDVTSAILYANME